MYCLYIHNCLRDRYHLPRCTFSQAWMCSWKVHERCNHQYMRKACIYFCRTNNRTTATLLLDHRGTNGRRRIIVIT